MQPVEEILQNSHQEVDLADSAQQQDMYDFVERLRELGLSISEINQHARNAPLQFKLAAK